MPLIQKMVLTLLGIALIPVFLVTGIFYLSTASTLQASELNQLSAIASIQESRINTLIQDNDVLLTGYTSRTGLLAIIDQYNQESGRAAETDQLTLQESVNSLMAGNPAIESASILNPGGIVIAATDSVSVGRMYKQTSYVSPGRVGNNTTSYIVRDQNGNLHLYLVGPFKQSGSLIGIAVIETNMQDFVAIAQDYTGLGTSGETILARKDVNGNAEDLLPLRFSTNAALQLTIPKTETTQPIVRALENKNGTLTQAVDYSGHKVLAATRYIKGASWGLAVMVDQSEAYQSLGQLTDLLLILMFILSVVIIFVSFYLARSLNDPILSLEMVADQVGRGDLSARAEVKSHDEIGQLAETFNAMADNMERVDQMKSEFVLLTSHQLRTPATAVKGFISMLLDGYAGKLTPEHEKLMRAAYDENERQISVINSILDVARMEAGEMVLNRSMYDIGKVIEDSANAQSPILASNRQTISVKKPKRAVMNWVDHDKLQLVVDNLIHNATKYSPRGSHIQVELKRGDKHDTIEVSDEGIGIAKEDMGKLFKRFSRIASPQTVNVQGAGLGLYLADRLIKMHGGKIHVKSVVGRGTSFTIELPITKKEVKNG